MLEINIDKSSWYKDEKELVIRWVSNNSIPPQEYMDWLYNNDYIGYGWYVKSNALRTVEKFKIVENYRKQMENHVPDDEEMFEMRSAFGEGTTVVNVITGKRTIL